ncbi:hypothetical protein KSP40_PGU006178 [Platanthera guangdongensis]|uniref:Uncharacterized protein n=1 Tax=Platanthera guangdongensis TaxID=2320717 RepID=A0ABR2MKA8_9ASPA
MGVYVQGQKHTAPSTGNGEVKIKMSEPGGVADCSDLPRGRRAHLRSGAVRSQLMMARGGQLFVDCDGEVPTFDRGNREGGRP